MQSFICINHKNAAASIAAIYIHDATHAKKKKFFFSFFGASRPSPLTVLQETKLSLVGNKEEE
jgi:hypothetical protein